MRPPERGNRARAARSARAGGIPKRSCRGVAVLCTKAAARRRQQLRAHGSVRGLMIQRAASWPCCSPRPWCSVALPRLAWRDQSPLRSLRKRRSCGFFILAAVTSDVISDSSASLRSYAQPGVGVGVGVRCCARVCGCGCGCACACARAVVCWEGRGVEDERVSALSFQRALLANRCAQERPQAYTARGICPGPGLVCKRLP